jgi:hypothetical protein
MSICSFSMSSEVRLRTRDKLVAVTKGADPSAERRAIGAMLTVGDLCDLYLAEGRETFRDEE